MIQRFDSPSGNLPVLWVKDDRYSIRQGDFTPAELRQIAEEMEAEQGGAAEWVVKRMRIKNLPEFQFWAVVGQDRVYPFVGSFRSHADDFAEELRAGSISPEEFSWEPISKYEEVL